MFKASRRTAYIVAARSFNRVIARRQVVLALGASVLVAPLGAVAQPQGRVYRVGYLSPGSSRPRPLYDAFLQATRELGYAEGLNLVVERRFAEGKYESLPALAAELVKLDADVIVAVTTPASLALQKATSTVPVVAVSISDPVASGLAKSLGRPGGNITGLSDQTSDMVPKLLELLKVVKPALSRVALLINPANPNHLVYIKDLRPAANLLGVTVTEFEASTPQDIERAFPLMAAARSEGLIVTTDLFLSTQGAVIAKLAMMGKLPAVFAYRPDALAGGLISYGPSYIDLFRRAAGVVDKILKGAKPSDLPFEQPMLFDLIVNLKTANALGIKMPQSLVVRATEVIE